ncbi:SusC/RagA family TonB-linked outer membrane protein [Yeosuana sp. AK3]
MKVLLFYVLLIIPIGQFAFSQNTITGTVTDSNSQPLPGATILKVNTKTGTTTDFDGAFSIQASQGDVLEISFIGFQSTRITVGSSTTYQITLEEDAAQLDEVVVVGYGTQKKVDLTSSVQSVVFKEEVNQPVTNSGQLMYGRFSGVQLTQTTGNPGADGSSIVIRGIGTFGGTAPLIVIDNIQYDDLSVFNSLAPADIESITVLKDASAGAIYGARGANGVVLVTTRGGTADKFEINYNSYYGIQEATVLPEFLGSFDYATLINEKFRNEDGPGFLPRYTTDQLEAIRTGSSPDQFANTNWADEILRQASIQSHNLSFSGGSEKTTYRLSMGYLGQDAIVRSKFKTQRYNLSFNINSKLKEWFTLNSNTNMFWRRFEGPTGGQNAFSGDNGILFQLQRTAPTIPVFYSNGQYGVVDGAWENPNASFLTQNPLRRGFLGNFVGDTFNISQRIGLSFQLTKNLSFETSGSANIEYVNNSDFSPLESLFSYDGVPVIVGTLNNLDNATNLEYTLLNENILKYNKTIADKHNLGFLLGHTASYFRTDNFSGTLSGFPTNNIEEFNGGGITNPAVSGGAAEDVLQSFFGRLNYDFDGKYFAQFSMRRDGTSRFGLGNLYGSFPSASVGWRISEENFMDKANFINNLKLRVSWGESGNNRIERYIFEQTYNPDQDYVLGSDVSVVGVAITRLANPNIRWELTEQYDIGLDLNMFKNKVEFIADYFNRDSQDILYDQFPVPNTLGVSNLPAINAASMINRGLELAVNYRDNIGEDISFSVGANMTKFLKNEVTGLGDGGEETITNTSIIRIGEAFGSYYGLKAIGVFQDLDEIANSPTQFGNISTGPGDLKYADISGPNGVPDGVVDDDDRTIIGNPNPDLLINFNGSFEFKGFDFNFLFQGVSGVDRLLMGNGNLPMSDDRSNVLKYWINRWTPENPSANLPRVGGQNNTRVSSFYVQDASYLRLKSIELGYSLPTDVLQKIGMTKLRVFLGAQNLFTFTGLEFFDPEGGTGNQSNRNVPLYKTITFGLNAKL